MFGAFEQRIIYSAPAESGAFFFLFVLLSQRYLFGSNKVIKNENPCGESV